ncbi:NAC domain-containing protein 78-like [Lycium ferocissimum]|uniref:NAC domain-containing protein 78-like n=1 Tax=Lycium ferocissimum TaxID=112874 RepID=UPI0028168DE5|nr:NAC domain-containing protein 78-like [Lycium ferocissimum]
MELENLEEGYRFHPTDSELLTFLLRFIAKQPLCDDGYITEHDVYKQEPWKTYNHGRHCGGQDDEDTSIYRYFITPRQKKGNSFCRVVGEKLGTWKQQDKGKNVTMSYGNQRKPLIIGRMKSYCYENTKYVHGKWLMKEYVFCDTLLRKFENSEYKDYVICAIKKLSKKNSSNGSQSSNLTSIDFVDEPMVDTEVTSGVNSVEPLMDHEYKAITPINVVEESMVESATGEENGALELSTSSQIQESKIADFENAMPENNVLETMDMLDQDYEMISPINIVEEPMVEFDDLEVKIQEAAGEENGVLGPTTSSQIQEFENAMPEINLPKEKDRLTENTGDTVLDKNQTQEGCIIVANEDYTAYLELEAKSTSFVELLTVGGDSAMKNNQVQTQEAPGDEINRLLRQTSFSQIHQPVIPDFANGPEKTMPEILNTLAEYMGVTVLMYPDYELTTPFDFSEQPIVEYNEPQVQTQEAAGEENGLLRLTDISQNQEHVMPEINVPEMFDTGDTLFEKNETQQETLCETEESSFISDLVEDMSDHATMKERLAASRMDHNTLMLDQQSWLSKTYLQDMLL